MYIKQIINSLLVISVVVLSGMLLSSFQTQPGNDPLTDWDTKVLREANTASSVAYIQYEEKKLIFYANLCRLKPKLFCNTVLASYLSTHQADSAQVLSLKAELNQDKACGVVVPDKDFCAMAHDFAKKMGQDGREGHDSFQIRMAPFISRFKMVGENCDYGNELAIDAFMNLLIDSSDPVNLAHRKNILNPAFKEVGVARAPHKTYKWNYVMDFGG